MMRFLALLLGFTLAVALFSPSPAEERPEPEARILSARSHIDGGRILLDADIHIIPNKAVRRALPKGLPIDMTAQIEIFRPREFWWDESVHTLKRSFRLEYHELSQQYVIESLDDQEQRIVSVEETAIHELGRLRNVALIDASQLAAGAAHYGKIRVELSVEEIPLTLKASTFMSDDWIMRSNSFTWSLQ